MNIRKFANERVRIGNVSLEILIERTKRKRTISLQVKDNKLIIKTPRSVSKKTLVELIKRKQHWINQRAILNFEEQNLKNREFIDNDKFYFRGDEYRLSLILGRKEAVKIEGGLLLVSYVDDKSIELIKTKLMNRVSLITPNIPEAEILAKIQIKTTDDMIIAGKKLLSFGAKNVLIKGGHLKAKYVYDLYLNKDEKEFFKSKKIKTKNTHGTGCTLSSAIATYFSCGKTLKKSCKMAIDYVNHSIGSGPNFGKGHGPINHISVFNIKNKFK